MSREETHPKRLMRLLVILAVVCIVRAPACAAEWPAPVDGAFVVEQLRLANGETLRYLRLHQHSYSSALFNLCW